MKFIRWLGAFGKAECIETAIDWELSQVYRHVATEPLWRGHSLIRQSNIGLVIDESASMFIGAWLTDAYTRPDDDGALISQSKLKRFKDKDRFLATWNKLRPNHHAEAVFAAAVYSALVVKATAPVSIKQSAAKVAAQFNLEYKEAAF